LKVKLQGGGQETLFIKELAGATEDAFGFLDAQLAVTRFLGELELDLREEEAMKDQGEERPGPSLVHIPIVVLGCLQAIVKQLHKEEEYQLLFFMRAFSALLDHHNESLHRSPATIPATSTLVWGISGWKREEGHPVGSDVSLVGMYGLERILASESEVLFIQGDRGDLLHLGERDLTFCLLPPYHQGQKREKGRRALIPIQGRRSEGGASPLGLIEHGCTPAGELVPQPPDQEAGEPCPRA